MLWSRAAMILGITSDSGPGKAIEGHYRGIGSRATGDVTPVDDKMEVQRQRRCRQTRLCKHALGRGSGALFDFPSLPICLLRFRRRRILIAVPIMDPVFPPGFLHFTRLLLPLDIRLHRCPALGSFLGVFKLVGKQTSGNGAVLGPRSRRLRLDHHAGWNMLQLYGRGSFILCSTQYQLDGSGGGELVKLTIFCPPGPLPLRKLSSMCSSGITRRGERCAASIRTLPRPKEAYCPRMLRGSSPSLKDRRQIMKILDQH